MKNRKDRSLLSLILSVIIILSMFPAEGVRGAEAVTGNRKTAEDYYQQYGSQVTFIPDGSRGGRICFGQKAHVGNSTGGTYYTTIGWKLVFTDAAGEEKQSFCLKLGGDILSLEEKEQSGDYYYQLYEASWQKIEALLTAENRQALEEGELYLHLDACIVVGDGSIYGGSMEDDGTITGRVYTTYQDILGAADWGPETRTLLLQSFGRSVKGLFIKLKLTKGEGIRSVDGAGNYCYGSKVTITAVTEDGYKFAGWTGSNGSSLTRETEEITLTENLTLEAAARTNRPPVIDAWNLYYSVEAAEAGQITPEEILSHYQFLDPEDGELTGNAEYETIRIPSEEEKKAETTVVLRAVDSDGNQTEKEIIVKVYRKSIKKGSELTGTIRFISGAYYINESGEAVPESEGGLRKNSIWLNNAAYRQLLYSLLQTEEN